MDPINPPAIFRSNVSELIMQGKSLNEGFKRDERAAIEKAIAIGRICIKLKEEAGNGGYTKALEAMGVAQQRASEFSRMAKAPPVVVCKAESLNDLRKWLSEQQNAQVSAPVSALSAPPAASTFCRDCRINGPKKNCKDCAALGKAPGSPVAASGTGKADLPETEEARDLEAQEKAAKEAEAAAKKAAAEEKKTNGQEVLNWKTFSGHFTQIVQTVDRVARAYEFKESPEHRALHDLLREFLQDFRKSYEAKSKQKLPER